MRHQPLTRVKLSPPYAHGKPFCEGPALSTATKGTSIINFYPWLILSITHVCHRSSLTFNRFVPFPTSRESSRTTTHTTPNTIGCQSHPDRPFVLSVTGYKCKEPEIQESYPRLTHWQATCFGYRVSRPTPLLNVVEFQWTAAWVTSVSTVT
ncbi:hypothetical protein PAXRUDRAFT_822778 [Paxillus rubicundulus Ve08.2h10]|uniref:Uncharacterized protein n=1 Tax=Paxillus rubicundulus Ve08.2h10 TaxID=930991 RepID=A0A0D0DW57_9AGAM|nr:hypothetical protein PAXRUDRAFT_822778 [Paxillus rubicundulus Ve08.2h10]